MKQLYLLFLTTAFYTSFAQNVTSPVSTDTSSKNDKQLTDVVVSATRRETALQQSPVTIFSKTQAQLRNSASGNIYYSLATLPQTDIIQLGGNISVINTRGFNDAFQTRFVQLVNGVDVQLPALNVTTGNLTGPIPIDIKRAELIAGPSSAMFGANALQGVSNLITTNPLDGSKLSVQLKGGNRDYIDVQALLNVCLLKNNNLGLKFGGAYNTMLDWIADDPAVNTYGKINSTLDVKNSIKNYLSKVVLPAHDSAFYLTALNYFNTNSGAYVTTTTISAPGIKESALIQNRTVSAKATAGIYYNPIEKLSISYQYNFSMGNQILQGTTRYQLNTYSHVHDFELKYDGFKLKANYNSDKFFDSYNLLLTGNYMSASNMPVYINSLLDTYYKNVYLASNGFSSAIDSATFKSIFTNSRNSANSTWWTADSDTFKKRLNQITTNGNSLKGSALLDESRIFHTEASYSLPVKFMNIDVLAYFRYSSPVSFGTLFQDTLVNRAEAPADGSIDRTLKYKKLTVLDGGGMLQLNKSFFKNVFDIWASVRVDKNSNFKVQVSPRGGLVFNMKGHSLRATYQFGFRNPTLQNQYARLDLGQILLLGNITGFNNLLDLGAYTAFGKALATGNYDTTLLQRVNKARLQPESVHSLEIGYRGKVKSFFFEATGYFNWYNNFIANYRGFLVNNAQNLSNAQLADSVRTGKARLVQIPFNFDKKVQTYGVSVMVGYKYKDKLTVSANYTYSGIILPDSLSSSVLPGYNTPPHKVNIAIEGTRLYRGLGASALFRWTDKTNWQSAIGNGVLSANANLDMAVFYEFDKPNTRITFGCTNVTGAKLKYAIGAPVIGRTIYATLNFDIPFVTSKK